MDDLDGDGDDDDDNPKKERNAAVSPGVSVCAFVRNSNNNSINNSNSSSNHDDHDQERLFTTMMTLMTTATSPTMLCFVLAVTFCLTVNLASAAAESIGATGNGGAATAQASGSLRQQCLDKGFDPMQLSCDTCVVLKDLEDPYVSCLECCQSYKSLDSKTTRYQSAVLSFAPGSEETDKFVDEDVKDLAVKQGSFSIQKANRDSGGFYGMRRPSVMYFFDQAPPPTDMNRFHKEAKEEIFLDGWKRDDIKDMIHTLLPHATTA